MGMGMLDRYVRRWSKTRMLLVILLLAWLPGAAMAGIETTVAAVGRDGIRTIALGVVHGCGLREDGTAQCWGYNQDNRATPPAGQRFIALTAGNSVTCGLRVDGTALCWGPNQNGENNVPAGVTFSALAAKNNHVCGLKVDGTAQCWGSNAYGESTVPAGVAFVALVAGDNHTCGLRTDRTAQCWGQSAYQGTPPAGVKFKSLAAGQAHTCGVRADGGIQCWGYNTDGQATAPTGVKFTSVEAAYRQTCGVRTDGFVQCWGGNYLGETSPPAGVKFSNLAMVAYTSCGVRDDGTAQCWGSNSQSVASPPAGVRFGFGAFSAGVFHTCRSAADGTAHCFGNSSKTNPVEAPADLFKQVAAGYDYSCGVRSNGAIGCWGAGLNSDVSTTPPSGIYTRIATGLYNACGIDESGSVSCWGSNSYGESTPPTGAFVDVAVGAQNACGIRDGGTLACWGSNGVGQNVPPSGNFVKVSSGFYFHCAIGTDGGLACWGRQPATQPTGTFRSVSAYGDGACATRTDGTLACWGTAAGFGSQPVGGIAQLATGYRHACAVRDDGTSVCWGNNDDGQAPMPVLQPSTLPTPVAGQSYSATFSLTADRYAPVTPAFAIVAGSLPPGLVLAANGALTGSATTSGTYPFTVEGEDANGFAASASYAFSIDLTPPVIVSSVSGTQGTNGWYIGDVSVSWSVTDAESAISSSNGCTGSTLSSDSIGTTYTCTAASAGGTTTKSVTVKRDAMAPDTSITSRPANPSDSAKATFVFSGTDATSGVTGVACSLDGSAFADCTNARDRSGSKTYTGLADGSHTFQVRSTDNAGLVDATPASYTWTIDTDDTAPVIVANVSGPLGNNGWYVGNVGVSWSVTDPESAISSTSGCDAGSVTSDTAGVSFTCTATSIGGTSSKTVTVKRDATAPVVVASATTAPNDAGWYRSNVTVAFSCSDALSGEATCPGNQTISAEGSAVSSTAMNAVDQAGNVATSNVVTVNLDKTAPTLSSIVSPSSILLNGTGSVSPNAGDSLSGVTTQSCGNVATSTVGSKTVTCRATDLAGNTATAGAAYRVVYGFAGFAEPVRNGGHMSLVSTRRSVPFAWRLYDANDASVTTLATAVITSTTVTCPQDFAARLSSYGDLYLQLQNLGGGNYKRNWKPSPLQAGTCARVNVELGDGRGAYGIVQVRLIER